jgi:protoporphyrinogen oxidase
MQALVLGGGLAGLACAYELAKAGAAVTLLEKEAQAGGMAHSMKVGPFTLDHGPHRFHTRDPRLWAHLEEVVGAENLASRDRLSRIYLRRRFFHYPLVATNVLRNLPPHVLGRAVFDYLAIRLRNRFRPIPDDCFENWVLKRFGATLYRMFFGMYTEKAWGMSCREISADWASQRITLLNLGDTIKKTLFRPKEAPRTLVSEFRYPREGGVGTIAESYARHLARMGAKLLLGTPVDAIFHKEGRVTGVTYREAGGEIRALRPDFVVSTIPLPRMIERLDPAAPAEVLGAMGRLRYIGIVFVYLEVAKPQVSPDHWVYLPEKHLTIHRISEFKNFSERTAPPDRTAVCAEITCKFEDPIWNLSLEEAGALAIRDLETIGLLRPGQAKPLHLTKLRYAYPVYDLHYRENLRAGLDYVKGFANLQTTGRQGLYRYNNMDHSIAMGRKIARSLLQGEEMDHHKIAAGHEYFG